MSIIIPDTFKHIHRVMNTSIDGTQRVPFALTAVPGIGRRFADIVCKKAGIDLHMRAGCLTEEQWEQITQIVENPKQYGIPNWMLNRQRDWATNEDKHIISQEIVIVKREDLERLRKIGAHRATRTLLKLKVRGQRTKATGRCNSTVGVQRKKK